VRLERLRHCSLAYAAKKLEASGKELETGTGREDMLRQGHVRYSTWVSNVI